MPWLRMGLMAERSMTMIPGGVSSYPMGNEALPTNCAQLGFARSDASRIGSGIATFAAACSAVAVAPA
jgi:hypothetical protein